MAKSRKPEDTRRQRRMNLKDLSARPNKVADGLTGRWHNLKSFNLLVLGEKIQHAIVGVVQADAESMRFFAKSPSSLLTSI